MEHSAYNWWRQFIMKTTLTALFILISSFGFSQNQVLNDYDFSKNNYKIFISHNKKDSANSIFSLAFNKSSFDSLKKVWIGEETTEEICCGVDYTLYLVKPDSSVDILYINSGFRQVYLGNRIMNFSGNPLKNLKTDRKAYRKEFCFLSLDSARKEFQKLSSKRGYYILEKEDYDWVKYDGYFAVQKKYDYQNHGKTNQAERYIKVINQNKDTKILLKGYGPDDFVLMIYSNYDFYKNLNEEKKTEWHSFENEEKLNFTVISENEELLKE